MRSAEDPPDCHTGFTAGGGASGDPVGGPFLASRSCARSRDDGASPGDADSGRNRWAHFGHFTCAGGGSCFNTSREAHWGQAIFTAHRSESLRHDVTEDRLLEIP